MKLQEVEEVNNNSTDDTDDNNMLSISEIDMLRHNVFLECPCRCSIERGDKVTISLKYYKI